MLVDVNAYMWEKTGHRTRGRISDALILIKRLLRWWPRSRLSRLKVGGRLSN